MWAILILLLFMGGGTSGGGTTDVVMVLDEETELWYWETADGRRIGGPFVSKEHARKAARYWAEAQIQKYFIDSFKSDAQGDGWYVWHPFGDLHGPFDRRSDAREFAGEHFGD